MKGFSKYEILNDGTVYRKQRIYTDSVGRTTTLKRMKCKPRINKHGYYEYTLINDLNKSKSITAHRLVALEYIPNPNNYPVINHIDGNKLNNKVDNLEWCTFHHNNMHAVNMGLYKNLKSVTQLDKNGKVINTFKSIREAGRMTGIDSSGIAKCCKGKRKIAGGYCWRYN